MDKLTPATITGNLKTRFIGRRLIYYPRVTSTMEVARREARQGAAEGTTIMADEQTAGRGRLGRLWWSPPGSLALSVILHPGLQHLSSLIMVASVAVVRSIQSVTGLKCQIKWPNDVLINGKKVCGILMESALREDTVDYAIMGIGINVNLRLTDFPEILPIATSLSQELGREISRRDIICQLLAEIERLYLTLRDGGSVYEEWRDNLVTLGQRVRLESGQTRYEGVAEAVARDGSLLLRQPDGNLASITAGDITLRDYPSETLR